MRISGTEPSSVILSQTKWIQKLKMDAPKVPKRAEAKRDGVINPQNYNVMALIKASFEYYLNESYSNSNKAKFQ